MILRSATTLQTSCWQKDLSEAIADPKELCHLLELDEKDLLQANLATKQFPLRVPRPFAKRIRKGDPLDPLLLQVWPHGDELHNPTNYIADPLGEEAANPQTGIIHKYHGRVLIVGSPTCAVNCRYCFRRHFPYQENLLDTNQWLKAFNYIRKDSSITEVILSGGDPLVVSNKRLGWIIEQLETIPHLERLRIHTRLPVVIPNRVDSGLLRLLSDTKLKPVVVIHCNHANEVDSEVATALSKLGQHCALLNQAVLLNQVNDSKQALTDLSLKLFETRTLPYYLHVLDKVAGAAHFDTQETRAIELVKEMTESLPGYLVPKLVREDAGAKSKTLIALN